MNLFAFDTFIEYCAKPGDFCELKAPQLKKLKMISIAEMGAKRRQTLHLKSMGATKSTLGYDELMRELKIPDVRTLEDLIIDCIYSNLLVGKLDQKNKMLHVHSTFGRDVKDEA